MTITSSLYNNPKIKHFFNSENQIFKTEYRNSIYLKDIKDSWIFCLDNSIIPSENKGILLDYRQAEFKMNPREILSLVDFYNNQLRRLGQCKIAILTERPDQIIIPILLSKKTKEFNIRVFTTYEAIIEWICKT